MMLLMTMLRCMFRARCRCSLRLSSMLMHILNLRLWRKVLCEVKGHAKVIAQVKGKYARVRLM